LEDIYSLFLVNYSISSDQDYGFYSPNGELLSMNANISTLLKDMMPSEAFRLKMKPLVVNFTCPAYPNTSIPFELDVTLQFSFYVHAICRKFGYPEELFNKLCSSGIVLSCNTPISRLKLNNELKIEVHFHPMANYSKEAPTKPREKREDNINTYTLDELIDKICLAQSEQGIECNVILID
jgi:hypothetical protein